MATGPKTERRNVFHRPRVGYAKRPQTPNVGMRAARIATFGRSREAARLECVNAGGQARQLPRHSILVEHALGDRPVQFGLRQLKSRSGSLLITAIDRRLDLLDESAHAAHPGPVDRRAFGDLAYALFRRFVTGHARSR